MQTDAALARGLPSLPEDNFFCGLWPALAAHLINRRNKIAASKQDNMFITAVVVGTGLTYTKR